LPNLICEILDHEEKKELRSKSYGSFILSLKNKEFTRNSLINLKNILLKYEPEIEVIINYRDKKIEHIHRPKEYSTFSDENGIARYYGKEMHVEIPRKEMDMEDYKRKIDLLPKNKQGVALKVGLQNSKEYIYYVHLISDKKTGDALDKGDRVGLISDGGSGHFDKYGSHGHTFTSPNLSVDKVFGFDDQTSPGTYKSLNILVEFLDQVINAVAKIVSQKNNEN